MTQDLARTNQVTVKDVAARAGVSTATVSRVLSGKGGVSQKLEQRVRQAIKELDYLPNLAARRLRERRAKIIGVLVSDIQIPFFASIVVGIEKILQDAGYLLLLGNTNDNLSDEQKHIGKFLGEDVTGVIFAPANSGDTSNYDRLQKSGVALVSIDRRPGELQVDTVEVENVAASRQAVQHLIQEGHRHIALISGPERISTAADRRAGYEMALQSAGLPVDPDLIQPGEYREEGGYRAMKALMESPKPPSAVLIANNTMALGALKYLNERNLDIPADVALVAYDDMPWASSLRPPLTVIAQPVDEIGTMAANLMLERIRNPNSSIKHITLEARLIVRASCSCAYVAQVRS
jgi:DNA-binding LacI/PurR family transcriptional regulator